MDDFDAELVIPSFDHGFSRPSMSAAAPIRTLEKEYKAKATALYALNEIFL